jgi:hypothetical protein
LSHSVLLRFSYLYYALEYLICPACLYYIVHLFFYCTSSAVGSYSRCVDTYNRLYLKLLYILLFINSIYLTFHFCVNSIITKLPCFCILFVCVYLFFSTHTNFVIGLWAVKFARKINLTELN